MCFITCFILTTFFSSAFASSCQEQITNPYIINLKTVGATVYVGDFPEVENPEKGPYTLTGGVCIENANGVQFITLEASVNIVEDAAIIRAEDVVVTSNGYELNADILVSDGATIELREVSFTGTNLEGVAKKVRYDFATQAIELFDSSVRGQSVTIESKRARLKGEQANFEELTATTCRCSGDPFYQVRAERADFNLTSQTLVVSEGTLELIGLRLAFREVTVSPESLRDFRFPVVIEYIAGSQSNGATGLGIKIPSLRLGDNLTLELGLVGLDDAYPLAGVFVVHYQDAQTKADIGLTPFGFQGDFRITQPLEPWLSLSFGVNNRHWAKADFLHESYLSLDTANTLSVFGNDTFTLNGQWLVAGSSQALPDNPILDGRLALNTNATYQAPALPLGQLSLTTQTRLSYYPLFSKVQWGVRLAPRWQHTVGIASFDVLFSRQWTNSNSPFSTKLDRLEPESRLIVNTKIAAALAENVSGEVNFGVNYNFLDVTRYLGEGFASLGASGKLTYRVNNLDVVPSFGIEFAPLMNPALDKNFRPLIKGGLDVIHPRWEAGFEINYDMALAELSKLEGRGSVTIDLGDVSLEPFLALDVLPTLLENTWPRLSGHGLELEWRSCCGTLNVGYRQFNNTFSPTFSVSLEQEIEITGE